MVARLTDARIRVRPYRAHDLPAVRRICADTGFLGKPINPVFEDRELFADYLTGSMHRGRVLLCTVIEDLRERPGDAAAAAVDPLLPLANPKKAALRDCIWRASAPQLNHFSRWMGGGWARRCRLCCLARYNCEADG
jgi:hypothetical protein